MSRTHFAARGALALGTLWAMAACDNGSNDIVLPRPVSPIFTSYVAIGNSITAGFQSDGINDSTQKQSYALLLARSMGTRYAYPGLQMPGCRPPIANFQTQARVTLAGQPASTDQTCNFRTPASITDALNNVAVPGVTTADPDAQAPPGQKTNALEQIILGGKSMVQRALDAHPTFATVWIGNNDILSPAIQGLSQFATAQPTTQAAFVQNYSKMIADLLAGAPGLKGVLIGVVQVANAPVMITSQAFLNRPIRCGIVAGGGTNADRRPEHLHDEQQVVDRLPADRSDQGEGASADHCVRQDPNAACWRHLRARCNRAGAGQGDHRRLQRLHQGEGGQHRIRATTIPTRRSRGSRPPTRFWRPTCRISPARPRHLGSS